MLWDINICMDTWIPSIEVMGLQVGYEQITKEADVVGILFKHNTSAKAARVFMDWLKNREGVCTHSEMNQFKCISISQPQYSLYNL